MAKILLRRFIKWQKKLRITARGVRDGSGQVQGCGFFLQIDVVNPRELRLIK